MNYTDELFAKEKELFFPTYKRLRLDVIRGEGSTLYTRDGKKYLDFFGGLAVNALGYGNRKIIDAIQEQSKKYIHLSNYYVQETQIELAKRLIKYSGYKKLFFTNSGTEAVEGAIKLARKWGSKKNKTEIMSLSNDFHGRTMGALSLTDRPKYREGYEPFLPNTSHIRFNDIEDLKKKVNEQTLGILLEFIQGEGGVNVVSEEFVNAMKELQNKYGFLIIADEIQSGIGRTGKFFGFENYNIKPDIAVVAKPIGGGLPLGAFFGNERVADSLTMGAHGTTFGGNPVACAAGCAMIDEIMNNNLMTRTKEIGDRLKKSFNEMKIRYPSLIKDVRGFGCMLGIELSKEGQYVVDALQEEGILINCTNGNVLRLLPPYIVTDEECDRLIKTINEVFETWQ